MPKQLLLQLLISTFILITAITQHAIAGPPDNYNFLNLTSAFENSRKTQKPIFLYFGRYGCSTCRKMHQEVFTDKNLFKKYSENFILAYVDTESSNRILLPSGERTTEMQFASRSRILGTPTFVYFSHKHKPLFQKAGFQSIEQMQQYSDYVVSTDYDSQTLAEFLSVQ